MALLMRQAETACQVPATDHPGSRGSLSRASKLIAAYPQPHLRATSTEASSEPTHPCTHLAPCLQGVDPRDFGRLADGAMRDACALTNPRAPTREEVVQLFWAAYEP